MLLHDKDQSVAPEKEDLKAQVSGLQQELHTTEAKMGSLEVRTEDYRLQLVGSIINRVKRDQVNYY